MSGGPGKFSSNLHRVILVHYCTSLNRLMRDSGLNAAL